VSPCGVLGFSWWKMKGSDQQPLIKRAPLRGRRRGRVKPTANFCDRRMSSRTGANQLGLRDFFNWVNFGALKARLISGCYPPSFYLRTTLVREFIVNPCMDLQKSTDINMDIHDFWMSVLNYPYKRGCPQWYPRISMQGHSAMDIRKQYP